MSTLNYIIIAFLLWCCWLDWVYPDDYGLKEEEDNEEKEEEEVIKKKDIWDNPILVASGLERPRFKTNCLTKDMEHFDFSEPKKTEWMVNYEAKNKKSNGLQ